MFYLSKIVWLLVQPLSLAFFLCLAGALLASLGSRKAGAALSFFAALVLFVALYTTTGSVALQVLEDHVRKPSADPADLSCIIVLGGALENQVTTSRGGIELNQAADRFVETARLGLKYPQAKILVSGGDGSISGAYEGEANASERFFSAFGISSERLIKENGSRNTFENTLNTAALLKERGLSDCLLITSAFHMPRSLGLFRHARLAVTPWPVDYRTTGIEKLGFDFTQPSLNAQQTATAAREWMGLVGYYLSGRTGSLLPE
ncbi:YdcF family protein [Neorhizobium sp. JUb45]|uniref:YdcF family protein n=1 Tax=unclassified Neorhizobium TaxID=2629175 RepID=UPI001043BD4C|nr:YdcF family protein [Neorhizobium sp. JUb45]